jgi:hypothetical protein
MAKVLALGSCRVMFPLKGSKFTVYNTNCSQAPLKIDIGYSYSVNEQLNIIDILTSDRPFRTERLIDSGREVQESDLLFQTTEEGDVTGRYRENLELLRREFPSIDLVVTEIGTLKSFWYRERIINAGGLEENSALRVRRATAEELFNDIETLVRRVDKPIIFVSHFLHQDIPNRRLIYQVLQKICSRYPQCLLVTPSNLWDKTTADRFLEPDSVHYLAQAEPVIGRLYDGAIERVLRRHPAGKAVEESQPREPG